MECAAGSRGAQKANGGPQVEDREAGENVRTIINGIEYEFDSEFEVRLDTFQDPRPWVYFQNQAICTVDRAIQDGIFRPTGVLVRDIKLRKVGSILHVELDGVEIGPVMPAREINVQVLGARLKIQVPSINTGEFQPPHRGEKE